MDGPSRSGGFRQSRRSRSQRDRERRRRRPDLAEHTSPSSASEQEGGAGDALARSVFPGVRHRPPRRRKRESVSCEEDVIDGFAIASFISLEALEMDCSMKPPDRGAGFLGRGIKRKRGSEENGGPPSEPEDGPQASFTPRSWEKCRKAERKRKREEKGSGNHFLETGYICDTESEFADKASDNDMEPVFFVKKVESLPVSSGSIVGNGCPLLTSNCKMPRLAVTPRVSGLERSQERNLDPPYPEHLSTSSSFSSAAPLMPEQVNRSGPHHRHHCASPSGPKSKSFLTPSLYGIAVANGRSKPPSSSSASSSMRPPTPSTSVALSHGRGPGGAGALRPPSRTFSPSLPPPPPLMQAGAHPAADQERRRQEVSSCRAAEREGRRSAGPSASGSSSNSNRPQAAIPMAYQFHQHNHQHQHTHTHQHFLHPTATASPLFEKYPGTKMESLFRSQYFPQYPPAVPGIQPVLPSAGPFSSLQGAFQPKGAGPDMAARLSVVPPHLQPKDPRISDPFAASLKVSNKPGKWCAMHVRVAWMILRHQEKVKMMQADPHKLDFRNDLLARLPGAGNMGHLGGLGVLGGGLPPAHDLARPGSLFAAGGGVNPPSSFIPPTPHSSFLSPAAHLDPYGRSPPFTPLGALGSGAFGGLGSPTLASSVFGHKDASPAPVGGIPNPHDPWNRLHVAPPSFPTGPSWTKAGEKREERERVKEPDRREVPHIKDEKDRDNLLYGRAPVRMSPGAPSLRHGSGTPISHVNGLGGTLSGTGGASEGSSRERERERDRDGDKRQTHSMTASRLPGATSSSAPDRPRSSSSSVLTTPPPLSASLASSPLDLHPRQAAPLLPHSLGSEPPHSSQRDSAGPVSSSSASSSSTVTSIKKSDRTSTPTSKPATGLTPSLLLPPVKVKEERKEEPEPIPIPLPHPPMPSHGYERSNSRHPHHPSSGLALQLPALSHPHLLERSRPIDAYLGPHVAPQGPSQAPPAFPWDHWRELAAQQQQQQQRREVLALRADPHMALRSDPHLSRLLHHQRFLEAERVAAAVAAASGPHHGPPAPNSASSASGRPEFSLMPQHFERPSPVGGPGGGLMDEDQRAQILREDFERARYFSIHPHLSSPHLPGPAHASHLEQLHAGLLSHSAPSPHHPGLYSRLGPLHPHSHLPNGILGKGPHGLVGALSVGAPPPLIPSVTSRASTPPRPSRLGGVGDLALYGTHKDGESR